MLVVGIVFNGNLSPQEHHFISISISFGSLSYSCHAFELVQLPESCKYVSGTPDTAQLKNTLILRLVPVGYLLMRTQRNSKKVCTYSVMAIARFLRYCDEKGNCNGGSSACTKSVWQGLFGALTLTGYHERWRNSSSMFISALLQISHRTNVVSLSVFLNPTMPRSTHTICPSLRSGSSSNCGTGKLKYCNTQCHRILWLTKN